MSANFFDAAAMPAMLAPIPASATFATLPAAATPSFNSFERFFNCLPRSFVSSFVSMIMLPSAIISTLQINRGTRRYRERPQPLPLPTPAGIPDYHPALFSFLVCPLPDAVQSLPEDS